MLGVSSPSAVVFGRSGSGLSLSHAPSVPWISSWLRSTTFSVAPRIPARASSKRMCFTSAIGITLPRAVLITVRPPSVPTPTRSSSIRSPIVRISAARAALAETINAERTSASFRMELLKGPGPYTIASSLLREMCVGPIAAREDVHEAGAVRLERQRLRVAQVHVDAARRVGRAHDDPVAQLLGGLRVQEDPEPHARRGSQRCARLLHGVVEADDRCEPTEASRDAPAQRASRVRAETFSVEPSREPDRV